MHFSPPQFQCERIGAYNPQIRQDIYLVYIHKCGISQKRIDLFGSQRQIRILFECLTKLSGGEGVFSCVVCASMEFAEDYKKGY